MQIKDAIRETLTPYAIRSPLTTAPLAPLTLVVAVSGGMDSIALLHTLHSLRAELSLTLIVAHVNHKLRASSDSDQRFVEELCMSLHIPCEVTCLPPKPEGLNTEAWARNERYRFFEEVRVRHFADWILTAHHGDDAIETSLMRMIANKEPRSIVAIDPQRHLMRPLLKLSREAIEKFVTDGHLSFVHDESNDSLSLTRNRVRHALIPFLCEHFGPSTWNSLRERAEAQANDEAALSALADELLSTSQHLSFGSREWVRTTVSALNSKPAALRWRVVERALFPLLSYRLGRGKALEVWEVWTGSRAAAQLPGGFEVRRSQGAITVSPPLEPTLRQPSLATFGTCR